MIRNLTFREDVANIENYIYHRLEKNELCDLIRIKNKGISLSAHSYLFKCLPTSVAVERSFSMLKKLLNYDRNFDPDNVYYYFSYYYNKRLI